MTTLMTKEEFFRRLGEIEQRLKLQYGTVDENGNPRRDWTFKGREWMWQSIESGASSAEDELKSAVELGTLAAGGLPPIVMSEKKDNTVH